MVEKTHLLARYLGLLGPIYCLIDPYKIQKSIPKLFLEHVGQLTLSSIWSKNTSVGQRQPQRIFFLIQKNPKKNFVNFVVTFFMSQMKNKIDTGLVANIPMDIFYSSDYLTSVHTVVFIHFFSPKK